MPRRDLSLSASAVQDLLRRSSAAAVAVSGSDGYPSVALGRLVSDETGVTLAVDADSEVGSALTTGEPVCLCVDDWPTYDEIQGVILRGSVQSVDDEQVLRGVVTSFDFAKAVG